MSSKHATLRVLTAEQMTALDHATIAEGLPSRLLMERAALCVRSVIRAYGDHVVPTVVLVGPGNNGADGSAVARLLADDGALVDVILCADAASLRDEARANLNLALSRGVRVLEFSGSDRSRDEARLLLERAEIWIDALLGTGATGALRPRMAELLLMCRDLAARRRCPPRPRHVACASARAGDASLIFSGGEFGSRALSISVQESPTPRRPLTIFAVDLPSGLDASRGAANDECLPADVTVTFAHPKWCHVIQSGVCGDVWVGDIGISRGSTTIGAQLVDLHAASAAYAPAAWNSHKGTRGHVLVVAGNSATPGAAILAAVSALRSGAGLVSVSCSAVGAAAVAAAAPELMPRVREENVPWPERGFSSIVIGPGLGTTDDSKHLLETTVEQAKLRDLPMVLDADALNLIAAHNLSLPRRAVLTPHPLELARLLGESVTSVLADLPASARRCREKFACAVVAKSAGSVVSSESGEHGVFPGHPGMATGGSGDVLAGIIGALLGQYGAERAAVLGAWLHADAGSAAGRRLGAEALIASEIIAELPEAFLRLAACRREVDRN